MRVILAAEPFAPARERNFYPARGVWPARWIAAPGAPPPPVALAYRHRFTLPQGNYVRLHVSADERYELFLDGRRVGRGSERGAPHHWFYESYDFTVGAGEHLLVARVWALGNHAPFAQFSVAPARFLLAADDPALADTLNTGRAPWEVKTLGGFTHLSPEFCWGTGTKLEVDGAAFDWGWELGQGSGWVAAVSGAPAQNASGLQDAAPGHRLVPAMLPAMREHTVHPGLVRHVSAPPSLAVADLRPRPLLPGDDLLAEHAGWQGALAGTTALTLPPHTRRRVIVDLCDYYCAYPEVVTSGGAGAVIRIQWAEALYGEPAGKTKPQRDQVEGLYYVGVGDVFRPDGGAQRLFSTLWWEAGRYLEVTVETAAAPLTLNRLGLLATGFPLVQAARFSADDARLAAVFGPAWRCLEMCSHETYMDCPYYEQLMYVGDTRLETLVTYVIGGEDRLGRKAIRMFDESRQINGLTQSRFPSRVLQLIPPFSLWWVAMVYDFTFWCDDLSFARAALPGTRAVLDHFLTRLGADGLLPALHGWNFHDWVPQWPVGMPPGAEHDTSGVSNWHLVLVLTHAAALEHAIGEPELAARYERHARQLAARLDDCFWDEVRGLYADDLARQKFSEHSQCLALLSGLLAPARAARVGAGLLSAPDLQRTTVYYTHYLFETYRQLGAMDALFARMDLWFDLGKNGFKTLPEEPGHTRSDCHAWGAHPLFHYFATVLGIRPAAAGFKRVQITPQLGHLQVVEAKFPHPAGDLQLALRVVGTQLHAALTLPPGITGTLTWRGAELVLHSGAQQVVLG